MTATHWDPPGRNSTETLVEREAERIGERLRELCSRRRLFATSSFQTQSLPLLHIVATQCPEISVAFLDTGYHFPETLSFRDELRDRLGLNLVVLRSSQPKVQQRDANGHLLFASNPDRCCHINKVVPLEEFARDYDVWVSGLRADQSAHRQQLHEMDESSTPARFRPFLGWNAKMVYTYRQLHGLPEHPLTEQGYLSVGCLPCTQPALEALEQTGERRGRWAGMSKTECGIHFLGR